MNATISRIIFQNMRQVLSRMLDFLICFKNTRISVNAR
jgi:hypothetical protein